MGWERIVSTKTLKRQNRFVFQKGNKSIAVIGVGDTIYAIDNRCPHQAYPLEDGIVDEKTHTLTCNWHYWQFDIKTGKSLKGGGNIRVYKTKIEDDYIWIDLPGH